MLLQDPELDEAICAALGRGRLATALHTAASLLPHNGRRTARGYETYSRVLEPRVPDQFVNLLAPGVVQRRAQHLRGSTTARRWVVFGVGESTQLDLS